MPLTPGTVLAGRYRLDDETTGARTGAGVSVWRGHDVVLDRPVRVRLLPRDDARTDAVLDAARSRARVDDLRTPPVLDAHVDGDAAIVVTAWPAGTTLDAVLADGPLDPAEAVAVVREVASLLAAAHAAGLAHLALGPSDVVVGPDAEVRVLGLAVEAVLRGRGPVDDVAARARTDTRLLGALLYCCLTARCPDDLADSVTDRLRPAPRAGDRCCTPRQVRAAVPPGVDVVCRRAMGEDVDGGPLDTPAALLQALDELGRPRRRGWPFRRRRREPAGASRA